MTCQHCAAPMTGRKRIYCDHICRNRAFNARRKADGRLAQYARQPQVREKNRDRLRRRDAPPRRCAGCGQVFAPRATYPQQEWCGRQCARWRRAGRCVVPAAHPARWYGSATVIPPAHPARWYGDACAVRWIACGWCGVLLIANTPGDDRAYCSDKCKRRVRKMQRRSHETAYPGDMWRGYEFERIARRFDYHCAYCGGRPSNALQPDHVIPVSRGGRNRIANLLPACGPCNASKRDLLLHEWKADRDRRNLPPVATSWRASDPRYLHLLDVMPSTTAAA